MLIYHQLQLQAIKHLVAGQVAYAIPALKGLTLSAEYENIDNDKTADANEFRFRANYKF